jgi:hypothetical protein
MTFPFSINGRGSKFLVISEIFQAITARDINERLKDTRHNTACGPDGIQRKHISGQDMREMLRVLFNIILISKTQTKAWDTNRTVMIPKQRKNGSRVRKPQASNNRLTHLPHILGHCRQKAPASNSLLWTGLGWPRIGTGGGRL